MTSALVKLLFLPCLCISGLPLVMFSFGPLADSALKASVAEVNAQSPTFNLYRETNPAVQQIKLVDVNTYDFILNFDLKQTVCEKHHSASPDLCPFSFALSSLCSSYVRISGQTLSLLDLHCGPSAGGSSSESSSEENVRQGSPEGKQGVFTPGVIICQGATSCSRLLL
ncbi:secreted phosphoprotein 24 isoform X2 [Hoplias malabaricus]|uniref:secreted phosphoprotein 24 isoform X2 n=1 Tax=Hoplias malabaricus TaxID=27720 RepID=UPI003461D07A